MPGPGRFRERLYRLLIRIHSSRFRRMYEEEMVETFRDAWRNDVRGRGLVHGAAFWLRLIAREIQVGVSERMRGGGGAGMRGSVVSDARLAWRSLSRRPGFSLVIVLTLGLGIGASTLVYSVVDFVLLRPLPYPDADRLVRVYLAERENPPETWAVTGAHYLAYEGTAAFDALGASYTQEPTWSDVLGPTAPQRLRTLRVSSSYFEVLSVRPIIGRTFLAAEEREGAGVALLSDRAWRSLYGADPGILGQVVSVDGAPKQIVGVVPSAPPDPMVGTVDVYLPLDLTPGGANHADNNYLTVIGRLAEGATPERAGRELAFAARPVEASAPEAARWTPAIVPLHRDVVGETRPLLLVLLGAVGILLAIVCVTVANLFTGRAADRRSELAVHTALGCSRVILFRRLLLESLMLAMTGGLLGALLAYSGIDLVARVLGVIGLVELWHVQLDGRVLVSLSIIAILTGLTFGTLPALRVSRIDPAIALRGGLRTGGRAAHRVRDALAVTQIAIALVLLTSAGLLVATFDQLGRVDLGFQPGDALTFTVELPESRYDAEARLRFHQEFVGRIADLSGEAVGAVSHLPATGSDFSWGTVPLSGPLAGNERGRSQGDQRVVVGDYFSAMGISLVAGRVFASEDGPDAPRRFVINRTAAERLYPGISAVGQRLRIAFLRGEVVGVVENTAVDVEGTQVLKIYHAHEQFADNRNWLLHYVVPRTEADVAGEGTLTRLRAILAEMDSQLVLFQPQPLAAVVGRGTVERRVALLFLLAFAGTATALAVLGLYAVLADSLRGRRRELAVRKVVGASPHSIRGLALGRAIRLWIVGIAVGFPFAIVVGNALEFLMFRVEPADPTVLAGVSWLLLLASVGAAVPTLWQVARVDPSAVLREE